MRDRVVDRIVTVQKSLFTHRDSSIMRRKTITWASGLVDSEVEWFDFHHCPECPGHRRG